MKDLNLRVMESKAWRANQQDGLFDLFFAVLFLGIALSQIADGLWDSEAATLGVLCCVQFGGAGGLWWARRRITQPRLGVVRFSPVRKQRTRVMCLVLAGCVAATLGLVVLTALSGRGIGLVSGPVSRTTVSAIAAALVLLPLAALAYFLEFPRILLHAMLFVGAEFGGTWFEEQTAVPFPRAILFGFAAVASAGVGVAFLVRFLRLKSGDPAAPSGEETTHA